MEIKLAKYEDLGDILKLQRLAYKAKGKSTTISPASDRRRDQDRVFGKVVSKSDR